MALTETTLSYFQTYSHFLTISSLVIWYTIMPELHMPSKRERAVLTGHTGWGKELELNNYAAADLFQGELLADRVGGIYSGQIVNTKSPYYQASDANSILTLTDIMPENIPQRVLDFCEEVDSYEGIMAGRVLLAYILMETLSAHELKDDPNAQKIAENINFLIQDKSRARLKSVVMSLSDPSKSLATIASKIPVSDCLPIDSHHLEKMPMAPLPMKPSCAVASVVSRARALVVKADTRKASTIKGGSSPSWPRDAKRTNAPLLQAVNPNPRSTHPYTHKLTALPSCKRHRPILFSSVSTPLTPV